MTAHAYIVDGIQCVCLGDTCPSCVRLAAQVPTSSSPSPCEVVDCDSAGAWRSITVYGDTPTDGRRKRHRHMARMFLCGGHTPGSLHVYDHCPRNNGVHSWGQHSLHDRYGDGASWERHCHWCDAYQLGYSDCDEGACDEALAEGGENAVERLAFDQCNGVIEWERPCWLSALPAGLVELFGASR
jgi:hypothetical protein